MKAFGADTHYKVLTSLQKYLLNRINGKIDHEIQFLTKYIPSHFGVLSNFPFEHSILVSPEILYPGLQVTNVCPPEAIAPDGFTVPYGITGAVHIGSKTEKIKMKLFINRLFA